MNHYGIFGEDWADMEWYIQLQSQETKLIADVTENTDGLALVKRFGVAFGFPSYFGTLKTKMHPAFIKRSTAKRQYLDSGSAFLKVQERRAALDSKLGFSRGDLMDNVIREMHEKASQKSPPTPGSHSKLQNTQNPPASGLELLQTFKSSFIDCEPELYFDLIGFWSRCLDILAEVKTAVQGHKSIMPCTNGTPYELVMFLLGDAADVRRGSRDMKRSALMRAAQIVKKYAEAQGSEFSVPALQQSSGHIPANLHPALAGKHVAPPSGGNIVTEQMTPEDADGESEEPDGEAIEKQKEVAEPLEATSDAGEERNDVGESKGKPAVVKEANSGVRDIREVFAARKKPRGRRLLRTRK